MTPKNIRFCDEYLIDLNATQAAIRAGYSKKSAYSQGERLLKKADVKAFIKEKQSELSVKTGLTHEWVLNRFKEVSDRCMQAIPVMVFDPVEKRMVQKTEVNSEGQVVGVFEFDSAGANKATELIGKHLGFFEKDNGQKAAQVTPMTNNQVKEVISELKKLKR